MLLSVRNELTYILCSLGVSLLVLGIKAFCSPAIICTLYLECLLILRVPLASHDELHLVVDAVLLILVFSCLLHHKIATLEAVDAYLLVKAEALSVFERLCTFDLAEPEWLVGIIKNEMGY